MDVDENKGELNNDLTMYMIENNGDVERKLVYSSELGLAIETIKAGYTLQNLWEILPS